MNGRKRENDQELFLGPFSSSLDIDVTRSEDFAFYDSSGKKYIDFLSCSCVANLGYSAREIKVATGSNKRPVCISPHFQYKPWGELARLLAELAPGELSKCYRTTGGSEAVDAAMQLAAVYTGRKKFLSVEGAYHGNTLAALSLGSSENRKKNPALLPHCYKIKAPLNVHAIEKLERRLKKKETAAFIMEPVITNLGVHIPAPEFMKAAQDLCRKYGTLLIMDEVASAFGRTGKLFACEYYNLEPDVICLAKALSGGYAGIGAVITTAEIASKVGEDLSLYSTYGWHPIAVDAAIANLRYWKKNKSHLLKDVTELSAYFRMRLHAMPFREKPEIRVLGMAMTLEFDNSSIPSRIQQRALENGLLVMAEDNCLVLFPAVNMDLKTAEQGLDKLENSLRSADRMISRMFRRKVKV